MRRTAALAAVLAALAAIPAAASPGTELKFTATRKLITLPQFPVPGTAYTVRSDLANTDGSAAGKLTINCTVIDVPTALPLVIEAQCLHIFRFQDNAEIHTTARVLRKLGSTEPQKQAIVGGTGRFRGIEGEGTIVFPDENTITYVLDHDV